MPGPHEGRIETPIPLTPTLSLGGEREQRRVTPHAAEEFRLFTDHEPPIDLMRRVVEERLGVK